MVAHSIDNITYARELFVTHKHNSGIIGEYVIEKSVLNTIIGLICTGYIPETICVDIRNEENILADVKLTKNQNIRITDVLYEIRLASFAFLKSAKVKVQKKDVFISNINLTNILSLLTSGTNFKSITENEDKYILKRA